MFCISRLSGEAFLRTEGLEVAFTRFQGVMCLKISARNRLKGKVVSVEKDGLMAKVKIEVSVPAYVTAVITRDATEDLSLKVGDQVEAVIKSTEVMIAK
jgi:molybdopterin-binding protein